MQLIVDGRLVFEVEPRYAEMIARGLMAKAKQGQELLDAERIAGDQAILMRTGAPFGLTNHPTIQRLAGQIAAWSSPLRRYLPGGVKVTAYLGTPTVQPKES